MEYITPAGYQSLRDEHQVLWQRRHEVVAAITTAAAEGDRSENAEYIYRKKELREVDRRLRYLGRRLDELKIARGLPADTGRVYFGAWVELEDDAGDLRTYRIVGADEIEAGEGWISMRSPLARALLGKALDQTVEVQLPGGKKQYIVTAIRYSEAASS
jgi:transcription elongation factor GreB